MYTLDLALNNIQWLICHPTKLNLSIGLTGSMTKICNVNHCLFFHLLACLIFFPVVLHRCILLSSAGVCASFSHLCYFLIFQDYSESSGKKSSNDKSKSDKNSVCETTSESEVTSKSNLSSLPLKSNGLYQTAPHRIDFQKYVIDPNRENYRRSSIADIPTANSSAENSHATQKEQHSKSLESSRTESQVRNIFIVLFH